MIADNAAGSLARRFRPSAFPAAARSEWGEIAGERAAVSGRRVQVAIVGANDRVHLDKVHIARDYGSEVQISGGLPADARIIANPPKSIAEGEEVRVAGEPKAEAEAGSQSSGQRRRSPNRDGNSM